jgi:hypothetical protein
MKAIVHNVTKVNIEQRTLTALNKPFSILTITTTDSHGKEDVIDLFLDDDYTIQLNKKVLDNADIFVNR